MFGRHLAVAGGISARAGLYASSGVSRVRLVWWGALGMLLSVCFPLAAGLVPPPGPDPGPAVPAAAARRVAPGEAGNRGWTGGVRLGQGQVPPPPPLTAAAALLMDWQTGQVLYERNGFVRRAPASTTKVMTAVLALEKGRLDDRVRVSQRAARTGGSSMHIKEGEVYTLRELLYGLLLNSGNDAAVAIAEHIGGSVEGFAEMMNRRARELGARSTHFVNPHGLHKPNHYSTAYDLALITRHALRHPVFAEIVRQRQADLTVGERSLALRNTNRLLWMFEGADGVKTGTTSAAGACLISSATRSDPATEWSHKLVAVVLNADGRWRDSQRLLEWGFTNFRLAELAGREEVIANVAVRGGRDPWVPVSAGEPLAAVVPRAAAEPPRLDLVLPEEVRAPVAPGQMLGTARVTWNGTLHAQAPLVAAMPVRRATWITYLVRPLVPWLRRLAFWGIGF